MTKSVAKDDFMFAPPVNEAYVERFERTVYWLNGSFKEHNELMKMISDESKRQLGWEKAVYALACDKNGEPSYKGKITQSDFHERINHSWARNYGGLIMGISDGDKKSQFDLDVEDAKKNSDKTEQAGTS